MRATKWSLTKRTRELAADKVFEDRYGSLLAVMFIFAGIADDVEQKSSDRHRNAVEWWLKWSELNNLIALEAREASWVERRPRAV